MSFTPRKYKDIFEEMRAMSQVVTDFEVGSVARTMYESFSYEMALLYEKMQLVYLSAYVDTAQGNQLDQVVAVLGIQRSQPDFAEGTVSFRREGAGQEIVIPAGTLVATEESSTGEKIVYETVKAGTLGAERDQVDVAVRAVKRGEAQETAADTVIVMPRPVPGIKFVNNDAPIRLVGKRRETDEELRERAKNTLISSGKATTLSIENALLSLSGVRDARVRENFHFPRALVAISNSVQVTRTIPRGTVLVLNMGGPQHLFKTLDPISFLDTEPAFSSKEVKVEAFIEGQSGEVDTGGSPQVLDWQDAASYADFTAMMLTAARLEDFGLIEVYVDAPRLEEGSVAEIAAERSRIEAEIEKVRAAGIFSILKPAGKVVTSAVFRIDLSASLNLTQEERREFENVVEDEIVSFLSDLRMGKPLLYGKLVKAILSLENIENLSDFRGTATRRVLQDELPVGFSFSDPDKFIAVEEFERIQARHIGVASEDKPLKVHIAYQSASLDATMAANVQSALDSFFQSKALGETVLRSEIEASIVSTLGSSISPNTLILRPESWFPGPAEDPRPLLLDTTGPADQKVVVTYVEQPAAGTIFGYTDRLELVGAIKLVLPLNTNAEAQAAAVLAVETAIEAHLAQLGPEDDLRFDDLVKVAESVPAVLAAEIDANDFRAFVGNAEQPNAIAADFIDIGPLQRAFVQHFAISGRTEEIVLATTGLSVTMGNPAATTAERDAVRMAIRNAFNNGLTGFAAGDDIRYNTFKGKLENLVVSVPYTISQLDMKATSAADGREQTASLGNPVDLHVRSVELAAISRIQPTDIILTN